MSITNSTLKHISFGENINWNILNLQKQLNPENKKKILRLLSDEDNGSSSCQVDGPAKKIKIKTAATFSSEDHHPERITEFEWRQGPATDRVYVSENPFLRAKADYLQKSRWRLAKKADPLESLAYKDREATSEFVTFRQLKKHRELKDQSDIVGSGHSP